MQDDYLTRCVVDPVARKFYLYSEQGDERVVDCETVDQFMSVLEMVREKYAKPMKLSSAFRDATHPVEARKGDRAGTGDHCRGVAVDVLVSGADALELIKIAQECGIDRIGIAQKGNHSSRFVHLGISDANAGKGPAIWSY